MQKKAVNIKHLEISEIEKIMRVILMKNRFTDDSWTTSDDCVINLDKEQENEDYE